MKLKDVDSKRQNFIISVVLLLIPMIALACRFDYYYDLNDDVLMKEILSGNYTGVPEGHNIQMLWLISAAISLLYPYRKDCSVVWYISVYLSVRGTASAPEPELYDL